MERDQKHKELYSCKYSDKTNAITISVHSEVFNDYLRTNLRSKYTFKLNKNENGLETSIYEGDGKCVITLYFNNTLFIQGKGCNRWKENVFDNLTVKHQLESSMCTNISNSIPITPFTESPTMSSGDTSRSPLIFINNLVNSLRSTSKRTPMKEANTACENTSPKIPVDQETSSTSSINTSNELENTPKPPQKPKQTRKSKQNKARVNIKGKTDNSAPSMDDSYTNKSNNSCYSEETSVKQKIDNESQLCKQELEKSLKLLREKYNEQKGKTGKLEQEVAKLRITLKTETDKNDNLKCELSSTTRKQMVVEEDITKLRNTIGQITREKSELVTQLIKMQVNSETVESKIQSVTDNMEIKLAAEMSSLKNSIFKELAEIKMQNQSIQTRAPMPKQQLSSVNQTSESNQNNIIILDTENTSGDCMGLNKLSVLIAGDSITRKLSPAKMSDQQVQVKIRSHPGGKVDTVLQTILEMNESEQMKELDLVVLHVGTNDISDGESPENVAKKLESAVCKVRKVCTSARVVVSSILPWNAEKVVNNVITKTNQHISTMCNRIDCKFLDNDDIMVENGKINVSLYRDKLHLNLNGGKALGTHMRKTIESVLKVKPSSRKEIDKQHIVTDHASIYQRYNDNDQQNFRYGRNTGRRMSDQRNLYRENYTRTQSPSHYQTPYHSQTLNTPRVTDTNHWNNPSVTGTNNWNNPRVTETNNWNNPWVTNTWNNPRVTDTNNWNIPRVANYNNLNYPAGKNMVHLPVPATAINKYM